MWQLGTQKKVIAESRGLHQLLSAITQMCAKYPAASVKVATLSSLTG